MLTDSIPKITSSEGCWEVLWCDPVREVRWYRDDPLLAGLPSLTEWARRHGTRARQPVVLHSSGRVIAEVNAFFASLRMRNRAEGTNEKYARGLVLWLNFLDSMGRRWHEARAEDVEALKFWRMTDEANPWRVGGSTVVDNLVAVNAFYEWALARYGVANPVERRQPRVAARSGAVVAGFAASPGVVKSKDVKWLDPAGYQRWRDVGLGGLDLSGDELSSWRGRNGQRDCAFADGLYGTGLRLTEGGSLLQLELPADSGRGYFSGRLAAACAKNSRGRTFWVPRAVLSGWLSYAEGERSAAVRRAQAAGRYERVVGMLVLERIVGGRRVHLRDADGCRQTVPLDVLGPTVRRRIFLQTPSGLAPAALWLNEDGLPRQPKGWEHTFTRANERVTAIGLAGLSATPHMLRHSMALRWYSVGKMLYERRYAHLDEAEMRDFRAQFGDTWFLVQTLLGHADVATTMDIYLEPFRDLEVELLIEHAHGTAMASLMAEMFADHPQVMTDPLVKGVW
ncbi:site-specific integrase [Streptomyces sp. NPDC005408]|uniref:site-specific integrase n=1 Tax=Streptomyces sp. NPDC005408 TaxID=3155341 RepID=UPI00339EAE7F